MQYVFSQHAIEQMQRRNITRQAVEQTLQQPFNTVESSDRITIFQSLTQHNGRTLLLRVFVNPAVQPCRIITAYRTSQISKYL